MAFPLWALLSGLLAFFHPPSLNWMSNSQFEQGVQLLMLAMGLSLSTEDFRKCAARPLPILLGFVAQFGIMPFTAYAIAKLMGLHPSFATGLVLLGCCPGGQASNVATFVARGDVALSVLMTTFSTMAAAIMTPALSSLLAGQFVPIDSWQLFESTIRLVLVPTLAGLVINEVFQKAVDRVRPLMPLLALALTVVLCAVPVAQVAPVLKAQGLVAAVPVFALHSLAYLLGYVMPKVLGFSERTARTVSIESGMQSAAMGFALSTRVFPHDVMVAVPSSISIVLMVWLGAALAAAWRLAPLPDEPDKQ